MSNTRSKNTLTLEEEEEEEEEDALLDPDDCDGLYDNIDNSDIDSDFDGESENQNQDEMITSESTSSNYSRTSTDDDNYITMTMNNNSNWTPVMDGRMSPKKTAQNKNSNNNNSTDHHTTMSPFQESTTPNISNYILGTLICRVIAARDLKPTVTQSSSSTLRDVIMKRDSGKPKARINSSNSTLSSPYHKNRYNHHQNTNTNRPRMRSLRGNNIGTSNPYAILAFANQTEITSTVYDTLNPSFPRHEEAYFDVSLPITHLAHEEENDENGDEHGTTTWKKQNSNMKNANTSLPLPLPLPLPPHAPILNIILKHDDSSDDNGIPLKKKTSSHKKHCDKYNDDYDDNDDEHFLGMASINVTHLITGKVSYIDEWLPLQPSPTLQNNHSRITGQLRIICEYDMTDLSPRPGDLVRFNGFVKPMDVFPIPITQIFRVDDIGGDSSSNSCNNNDYYHHQNAGNEDILVLSYRSKPEDWYCTFIAHRFMFISVERHVTAVERYHDEIIDIVSKVVSSPALNVVQKTVSRLPEEGLLFMGLEASIAGFGLAGRWMKGGVGTIVDDVVYATNLDGKSAVIDSDMNNEDLSIVSSENDDDNNDDADDDIENLQLDESDLSLDTYDNDDKMNHDNEKSVKEEPSKITSTVVMPCCPISGQPMKEPVVAADGHTYEKKAISRWFRTSNISPLTGKELPHKELVPNYLLISTFQSTS